MDIKTVFEKIKHKKMALPKILEENIFLDAFFYAKFEDSSLSNLIDKEKIDWTEFEVGEIYRVIHTTIDGDITYRCAYCVWYFDLPLGVYYTNVTNDLVFEYTDKEHYGLALDYFISLLKNSNKGELNKYRHIGGILSDKHGVFHEIHNVLYYVTNRVDLVEFLDNKKTYCIIDNFVVSCKVLEANESKVKIKLHDDSILEKENCEILFKII